MKFEENELKKLQNYELRNDALRKELENNIQWRQNLQDQFCFPFIKINGKSIVYFFFGKDKLLEGNWLDPKIVFSIKLLRRFFINY